MKIADELLTILPANRIRARYIDLVSFASDAGFYTLTPKAVVHVVDDAEVIALFQFSQQHNIPLVFRTGGTSLSGQAITDGILVDLSQFWNKLKIEDGGNRVRVQPGITGAMVNAFLKKHQRKIGPDPSSISAAMMGGILSNNASGMCCGVALNSYHTTKYIRFILPDGNTFSTEQKEDYNRFEQECNTMYTGIAALRKQVNASEHLYKLIRRKYLTKNTVGYSLNAFVDHEHPLDILAHLLIGAEGTLAFIAEAVMDTVPDYPFKSTALLYFPTIYAACDAIVPLTRAGALMVELMDRASLRAVENMAGMPAIVKTLGADASALLVEFQENTSEALNERVNAFLASAFDLDLLNAPVFTTDHAEQAFYWKVRKGLFPAVGAVRASGTTVILEDVAFPVEQLGAAIADLQKLFTKYAYHNAIIFGHAKDGNIHFVVTQSFSTNNEIQRYDHFMREVITLVTTTYQGALKAEHGTGRNMAPFVETEWGGEAYEIMKTIKALVDPHGLLNPGVIINNDPEVHIKNLKDLPSVEEEVDRCIECGYCEHRCPSRDITTTPRRRIVVRRVLQQLQKEGDTANHKLLLDQYQYDGMETCAVDGLCATACPVDINTGDLIKRLRKENHTASENKMALWMAKNFTAVEYLVRLMLKSGTAVNTLFGQSAMPALTRVLQKLISTMPQWTRHLGKPPQLAILKSARLVGKDVVTTRVIYFPACITRVMGSGGKGQKNLMETFISVCRKSNIGVDIMDKINGSCCSQIFSSKGFADAYKHTANRIVGQMWNSTAQGTYPIVIDVSSCAHTLHHIGGVLTEENRLKYDQLVILDSVDFLHDYVLPVAKDIRRKGKVVLHPVCSLEKMKTTHKFENIARHFATEVIVPENAGCCGMAGDRGFLFPELTASATHHEAVEVKQQRFDGYYSSTKTCEIAMSEAVQQNYQSILYLVDENMPA